MEGVNGLSLETVEQIAVEQIAVEQIYERVFRLLKPRTPVPRVTVQFRKYANANSRIRLAEGGLAVDISDLLQSAPQQIQEALAYILICKLYRKPLESGVLARYRRYLNASDVQQNLHAVKHLRGRKSVLEPQGRYYDLCEMFEQLNLRYFSGLMARPRLGWSTRTSRTTLGHYDPSHHIIVLSRVLDCNRAPALAVNFVMFHEMLHLRYPTQHRGVRRCVHTKEFKAAERQFEDYETAKSELKQYMDALNIAT